MCRLSWFMDPGGWGKAAAVGLYFIFPRICTLSLTGIIEVPKASCYDEMAPSSLCQSPPSVGTKASPSQIPLNNNTKHPYDSYDNKVQEDLRGGLDRMTQQDDANIFTLHSSLIFLDNP
ncbi:hypothetical protein STEG23_013653 [Scotinomys teguina]